LKKTVAAHTERCCLENVNTLNLYGELVALSARLTTEKCITILATCQWSRMHKYSILFTNSNLDYSL